jgi:plastocyanin
MVELWNRGDDAHDLRIRRLNAAAQMVGPVLGAIRTTTSGGLSKATWRLRAPGRYQLYCSLPGHLALGMKAELTVTRARH